MENQTMNLRLTAIETRLAAIEGRLAALEQGTTVKPKRKRDLSLEEKAAIRARLVAGKKAKRDRRLAEATAEAKKATKDRGD